MYDPFHIVTMKGYFIGSHTFRDENGNIFATSETLFPIGKDCYITLKDNGIILKICAF